MVAETCHAQVRIFEKSLQSRCSSYALFKHNYEESHGLCRNCKLVGTAIGRKLTARQRDSFIERYSVDES